MINLRKSAKQQKEERTPEIGNGSLKQTHDVKLAKSLSPITKNIEEGNKPTEALEEVDKTTKKLVDVIKESNSEKISRDISC